MARLSLTPDSARIISAWEASATSKDRELVARVLEWASDGLNGARFHCTKDHVDRSITVIQPRERLYIAVRMWPDCTPDHPAHFQVLSIFEDKESGENPD